MQHQQIRRFGYATVVAALLAYAVACSGPESRSHNPTAPTGVAPLAGSSASTASGPNSVFPEPGGPSLPPEVSGPSAIIFPSRVDALLFRLALEALYRDVLRRATVLTFVDQEGTVVWVQEFLRYRLNLCSQAEAIARVFQQIDGFGVPAVCGVTSTAVFGSRQELLDFMIQLEIKYQFGLRRMAQPTYVDVEGNVIWVQEYLRYRVSGCDHATAQQKVFDQIAGRGVQPDCTGSAPPPPSGGTAQIRFTFRANACGCWIGTVTFRIDGSIVGTGSCTQGGTFNVNPGVHSYQACDVTGCVSGTTQNIPAGFVNTIELFCGSAGTAGRSARELPF